VHQGKRRKLGPWEERAWGLGAGAGGEASRGRDKGEAEIHRDEKLPQSGVKKKNGADRFGEGARDGRGDGGDN